LASTKYRTLAAVLLASVATIGAHLLPGLNNSVVEHGIRDGLHILVFAAFAVVVFQYMKTSGIVIAIFASMFVAALIGGLSEAIQHLSGKQANVLDVGRDLSGAALGISARLLWSLATDDRRSRFIQGMSRSVSVLFGLAIVAPSLYWLSIIGLGQLTSPVILDFDQWWNKHIYSPIFAEIGAPGSAAGSACVYLGEHGRSGLVVTPMMTNWSEYEYLAITAGMANGPDTNVTIRINDAGRPNNWSDDFGTSILIPSNSSTIRIPLSELVDAPGQPSIDLSDIQELLIFARDRRKDTVMQIEDIRLE
jgi:VanZ family protein